MLSAVPDAQGSFCLLRSCTQWAEVLCSCRMLLSADTDIRSSLSRFVGGPFSDDDWRLASLGIAAGGLGARSATNMIIYFNMVAEQCRTTELVLDVLLPRTVGNTMEVAKIVSEERIQQRFA